MNKEEFEGLTKLTVDSISISAAELKNQTDRTLLYGYDFDRNTVHVYLQGGLIHYYKPHTYASEPPLHEAKEKWDAEEVVPVKRTYPDLCDAEFCTLLRSKGISPNFTTWSGDRADRGPFAGVIYPELER